MSNFRLVNRRFKYFLCSLVVVLIVIMSSNNYGQAQTSISTADKLFPADSGMINVKQDYGAKGDGISDDTQAIQQAIRAHVGNSKTIYFPSGTYLVSDRLEWRSDDGTWAGFLAFQGQNQSNTIIKLRDTAPGYTDAANPKAVIYTASNNPFDDTGAGVTKTLDIIGQPLTTCFSIGADRYPRRGLSNNVQVDLGARGV